MKEEKHTKLALFFAITNNILMYKLNKMFIQLNKNHLSPTNAAKKENVNNYSIKYCTIVTLDLFDDFLNQLLKI